MDKIDKMYYSSKKSFKLFGIKIFEIEDNTQRLDGQGEFIQESIPNKEYFEAEFRIKKNGG